MLEPKVELVGKLREAEKRPGTDQQNGDEGSLYRGKREESRCISVQNSITHLW